MRSKVAKRIIDKTPEETKIFVELYTEIVLRINHLLKKKKYSQKNLADQLGKRPSEINKWLISEHNFTIKSLAKLQVELGEPIINIPGNSAFLSKEGKKKEFTVYKNPRINTDVEFKKSIDRVKTSDSAQTLANVS